MRVHVYLFEDNVSGKRKNTRKTLKTFSALFTRHGSRYAKLWKNEPVNRLYGRKLYTWQKIKDIKLLARQTIMFQTNLQLKQINCACFYWRKMKHFNTAVIKCSLYLLRKRYLTWNVHRWCEAQRVEGLRRRTGVLG